MRAVQLEMAALIIMANEAVGRDSDNFIDVQAGRSADHVVVDEYGDVTPEDIECLTERISSRATEPGPT